ncbi:MAG: helix-turn-helix domain-containing protein [Promethearchaeota archaeon]
MNIIKILTERGKKEGKNKYSSNEKIEEFIIENLEDILMAGEDNNDILKILKNSNKKYHDNEKDNFEYKNLINHELIEKFKEYHDRTGNYANWGTKIRKNFIYWLEKKIEKMDISLREKNSLEQLKNTCIDINNSLEIKKFLINKIFNLNLSKQEISNESEKIGINLSSATISRILQELYKNKKLIRDSQWSFLDRDEYGNSLNHEEKIKKATEYLINEILTEGFKMKYRLKNDEAPSLNMVDNEIVKFRGAIGYRSLSYNEILVKAGLKINLELGKWSFLDYNEYQDKMSYKQSIEKAADYLINEILTEGFRKKYRLKKDEAPTITLENEKFNKFLSAIGRRDLFYNDILIAAGLRTNLEPGKWSFLDHNENKKPLSYEQAIKNAAEYLSKEILTSGFRKRYSLKNNEAPNIDTADRRLMKFRGAIGRRGLSYNDILREAGLIINLEYGRWSFLDYDGNRNLLSYEKAIEKAADYFVREIFTINFRKKHNLRRYETPTMNVEDTELQRFFSAIFKRNLSYNDILEKAGFDIHKSSIFSNIGKYFHWIQEYLFLKHTREKGCHSFYEPYINIKTDYKNNRLYKKYFLNHCDNAIVFNEHINTLSNAIKELYKEKRKNIRLLTFDYFLGNSQKYIKEHCLKGYQNHERMLILIPSHSTRNQPTPLDIPYCCNVKIMDPTTFSNFIGYKGAILDNFFESIELARQAAFDSKAFEELRNIALKCKKTIIKKYNYNHNELENFIKRNKSNLKMNLLKYRPDRLNLEYFLDSNNSKNI